MDLAAQRQNGSLMLFAPVAGWFLALLFCVLAYFPGLGGPFMMDDFAVLEPLAGIGGELDWNSFRSYVFSGSSGPTGRPLTLASFLLDATNWPADAWYFKRTNLIVHMLNGVLLGLLLKRILLLLDYSIESARWIALFAAGIWLLHPFLVSTTLYVVQRLAQLSTLFVLLGLLGHLYGRSMLVRDTRKAYLTMSLSIATFTVLATFSKENGALLPMLIACFEVTVFASRRTQQGRLNRQWMFVFVWVPSLAVVLYLASKVFAADFFDIIAPREFSIYERVLTEPRIIADYLQNWFVPKLYTTGIFQDHIAASSSLLSPVTTLLALVLHIGAIVFAIAWRRKTPLLALAILFFYAAHVLESTTLNLELYFEHRNYLPAIFLFVPLVAWLQARMPRGGFLLAGFVALAVVASFTRYSATIWGDYPSMVAASVEKAPNSTRAQAEFARQHYNAGNYDVALRSIDRAIAAATHNRPHLEINRLMMLCNRGQLDGEEMQRVAGRLALERYDSRLISIYDEFTHTVIQQRCPDVKLSQLRQLYVSMSESSENNDKQSIGYSQLFYFVGLVDVYDGEGVRAKDAFVESLASQPDASMATAMYSLLASRGFLNEALQLSEHAVATTNIEEATVRAFQELVRQDLSRRQAGDTAGPDQ